MEHKQIIEALLFGATTPLSLKKIADIVGISAAEVKDHLAALQNDYEKRAFTLEEIAHGYQLRSKKEFAPYVEELLGGKKSDKISLAASEVLAIIAYRQPITRQEVDSIRGVDSGHMIQTLSERGLIHIVGKKEVAGRPSLFATTDKFLIHFGLKSLQDLPSL